MAKKTLRYAEKAKEELRGHVEGLVVHVGLGIGAPQSSTYASYVSPISYARESYVADVGGPSPGVGAI